MLRNFLTVRLKSLRNKTSNNPLLFQLVCPPINQQLHCSSQLNKRKTVLDSDFVSRIMSSSDNPPNSSSQPKAGTARDDRDDDVQIVAEIPRGRLEPKSGKALYHPQNPLVRRHLDFTPLGHEYLQKGMKPETHFTVMSYNVLAQELLHQHGYLYKQNHPDSLHWSGRFSRFIREIHYLKPDILCLQEVQEDHFDSFFKTALANLGYVGTYKQRTGDKCDGCAMFWQESKLKLLEQTTVEFYQPGVSVLDKDNIALVSRLQLAGRQVVVATTHLVYNPKRSDIRLAQVQLLLAELDRVSHCIVEGTAQHHPVVLTGDFNFDTGSCVYHLITSGELRYDCLSKPRLKNCSGRSSPPLGSKLVPSRLGITDCCQHASVLTDRSDYKEGDRSVEVVNRELNMLGLYHSERRANDAKKMTNGEHQFGTGVLKHNLHLKSAYQHRQFNRPEATTHQDEWITVDYIFYSQIPEAFSTRSLKLLSTWRLPTVDECNVMGAIPNFDSPSDHLPILADFLLS
ncbi:Hypothetical predicted protein [Cloeon dipterum]|uniref:Endonuclease/exonuclease/phosphatase domain-containing protein n=1 Tax=Cloeon dipterum TaxID=197152 RepID=A0A8S1CSW4_9INSE|nr:Hypothetical predicted protein [Cloeon dipterum]